ncbi:MAG: hypothetical protein FD123_3809 [Bacteroidetes bacterium]|nr:MAG: hypothetical protein FD123_3809 [Bacteroidota bacterium]
MLRSLYFIARFSLLLLLVLSAEAAGTFFRTARSEPKIDVKLPQARLPKPPKDSVDVLFSTFLGNEKRNYYGDSAGDSLQMAWRCFLGKGTTIVSRENGIEEWYGAGWTGQPLVVSEKGKHFLIQGCYDHHLKKIDAETGEVAWQYEYDDILKGTGTIWRNDSAEAPENRLVILQGSRIGVGNGMASPEVYSYRAVSYFTGRELWRMNVKRGPSYSRDVDGSALLLNDTAYLGLENGYFISFDPGRKLQTACDSGSCKRPVIHNELPLFEEQDKARHGGNLVTEASPARIGDHIYLASGSGHVYGYNLVTKTIDWNFFTGSDLDGSPVVTADSCLLIAVEKQYIPGHGGILKLNPRRAPGESVDWFYPTGDFNFSKWIGGVIGSASVNDAYNDGMYPHLAAFTGIDGWLTVVKYDELAGDTLVAGPDGATKYPKPRTVFRTHIGPSISTPLFVQNKLVAAGYNGITLYQFDPQCVFTRKDHFPGIFESTPVADRGRIYIASRDGYLYCLGDTTVNKPQPFLAQAGESLLDGVRHPLIRPSYKNSSPVLVAAVLPKSKPVFREEPKVIPLAGAIEKEIVFTAPKKKTDMPAQTAAPEIEPEFHDGSFRLVAGVFKSIDNAERTMKKIRGKGVDAQICPASSMYYVCVGSGNSEDEMEVKRKKMQEKLGVEVWMKK